MASKGSEDQGSSLLEKFLERNKIDREELGKPPLANSQDPFPDRERIHLDSDEGDK
jgi:hypothetical protein